MAAMHDIILVIVADAGGKTISLEQAREHTSEHMATMHGYQPDCR